MQHLKNKFLPFIALFLMFSLLSGCRPPDPSKNDLQSPCVSVSTKFISGSMVGMFTNTVDPCNPRVPDMNARFLKHIS